MTSTEEFLKNEFNVDGRIVSLVQNAEESLKDQFAEIDRIREINQYKVLKAFQDNSVSDADFAWNTGYGYDDKGRDTLAKVYSEAFGAEDALVRTNIVSGTHALSVALMGVLRPGDEMIYCSGGPYDTLEEVIGLRGEGMGSLKEYGVTYDEVPLKEDGAIDIPAVLDAIRPETKMVCVQRSTGYDWRKAVTVDEIGAWASAVHEKYPDVVCMVDNCYGEFLDVKEPTAVGCDIMAGSLIKNPGGGIALSGGYVAGRRDLIEKVQYRMTCPGIGAECGLTFGQTRQMLQGFFLAPSVVAGAVKGAALIGRVYSELGYEVTPGPFDKRSDIIQSVKLGSEEAVCAFCEGIQKAAPIDSFVTPVPAPMPGYEDPVIMAAGAFVQGSSIELSSDAPLREPYIVYFQGGITYDHSKMGALMSLNSLLEKGLLKGF